MPRFPAGQLPFPARLKTRRGNAESSAGLTSEMGEHKGPAPSVGRFSNRIAFTRSFVATIGRTPGWMPLFSRLHEYFTAFLQADESSPCDCFWRPFPKTTLNNPDILARKKGTRCGAVHVQKEEKGKKERQIRRACMNVETAMKLMRRAKNVDTGLRIEMGDVQNEDHEERAEETKQHNEQGR